MSRISSPAADEVLGRYFPVLDHGFVALVDYMGSDESVERAARTSYAAAPGVRTEAERRRLIRYLARHRHGTPFEMVTMTFHLGLPIVAMRQLVRHRTACLTGDVELHFDLPGGIRRRGSQLYKLTVKQAFDRFHADSFRRDRLCGMRLRNLDESNLAVTRTRITDIWSSGEKAVYKVVLEDGSSATMSADHLCLTDVGWMKLGEAASLPVPGCDAWESDRSFVVIGKGRDTGVIPYFNPIDESSESWRPVVGWEGWYAVSDQGRVRRIVSGQGTRPHEPFKKPTVSKAHAVVSLSRHSRQETRQVHKLVLEAFVGPAPDGMICRHKDGNGLNNRLDNLEWATQQDNADDRVRDGATAALRANTSRVASIEYAGIQETFDIEVDGPWHNFSAGGMVVHNSLNEFSGRYSVVPLLFYEPAEDRIRLQSGTNKQGSGGPADHWTSWVFRSLLRTVRTAAANCYRFAIRRDVAREIARLDLPLSTYTYCYVEMDLRNALHFIGLRSDPHAQEEIRAYSDVIAGLVQRVAPMSFGAFQDYEMDAVRFSRAEMAAVRLLDTYGGSYPLHDPTPEVRACVNQLLHSCGVPSKKDGSESREQAEFWDKLAPRGSRDFSLDLATSRDGSYYADLVERHAVERPAEAA